jgi:hypothetical protein
VNTVVLNMILTTRIFSLMPIAELAVAIDYVVASSNSSELRCLRSGTRY